MAATLADDTFKRKFVKENILISIQISLKFVSKSPINNIPALVQIMAWRRPGDKPLSEPMMFTDAYIRHSASMSYRTTTFAATNDDKGDMVTTTDFQYLYKTSTMLSFWGYLVGSVTIHHYWLPDHRVKCSQGVKQLISGADIKANGYIDIWCAGNHLFIELIQK